MSRYSHYKNPWFDDAYLVALIKAAGLQSDDVVCIDMTDPANEVPISALDWMRHTAWISWGPICNKDEAYRAFAVERVEREAKRMIAGSLSAV